MCLHSVHREKSPCSLIIRHVQDNSGDPAQAVATGAYSLSHFLAFHISHDVRVSVAVVSCSSFITEVMGAGGRGVDRLRVMCLMTENWMRLMYLRKWKWYFSFGAVCNVFLVKVDVFTFCPDFLGLSSTLEFLSIKTFPELTRKLSLIIFWFLWFFLCFTPIYLLSHFWSV